MLDNVNITEIIKAFTDYNNSNDDNNSNNGNNKPINDCELIDCFSQALISIMKASHDETMEKLNTILDVLIGDEKLRFMAYFINLGVSIINYIQDVSSFSRQFYLLLDSMMFAIANNNNNCCPLAFKCKEKDPIEEETTKKLLCLLRTSVYPEFFRMFIPNCNNDFEIPLQLNPIILTSELAKHLVSQVFIGIIPMIMGMMSFVYNISEDKLTSLMNTMMRNLDTKGFLKTTDDDLSAIIMDSIKSQFKEEPTS